MFSEEGDSEASARAADRARVVHLDIQIRDLREKLRALELEKKLAQERLDSYKYPVLTVPNELISEIFLHVLPIYPLAPPLAGPSSPTVLSQICRRWREIALATPSLWRAIKLSGYDDPSPRQTETWLSRSGRCPLSIRVANLGNSVPAAALAPLIPHCARWEHAILHLSPSQIATIDAPLPLLRHLLLYVEPQDGLSIATFPHAPLLRSVVLDDAIAANIILPWAQLSSLTLFSVFPSECTPVLQQTHNILHCKLHLVFEEGAPDEADIRLPRLESLSLERGDPVTGYLETFIVPALRSLEIPDYFLGPDHIGTLTSFVSKSGCKLQKVHISGKLSLPAASYRIAFPSILFSFDEKLRINQ
ncbi:hypothetical protein DFH06DRAFT_1155067 [Mycena polygramma]|nr:hypothetical protein DFH06DRAFT_1155067 [Mycena polygramma]